MYKITHVQGTGRTSHVCDFGTIFTKYPKTDLSRDRTNISGSNSECLCLPNI